MSAPTYEGTTPLVADRYILTFIAGEDLTMGQVVELSAAWTVKKPTAINSLKLVGICLTSALNGKSVSVVCRGLCRAVAAAAIAVGDQLTNAATLGRVQTDNTSKNTSILGVALTAASAAGDTVYVLLW